jgi:hypothetical protein
MMGIFNLVNFGDCFSNLLLNALKSCVLANFLFESWILAVTAFPITFSNTNTLVSCRHVSTRPNLKETKGTAFPLYICLVFDDESSIWHLLFETSLTRMSMNTPMDI